MRDFADDRLDYTPPTAEVVAAGEAGGLRPGTRAGKRMKMTWTKDRWGSTEARATVDTVARTTRCNLSELARLLCVPDSTLRAWAKGANPIPGPALLLLQLIAERPQVIQWLRKLPRSST